MPIHAQGYKRYQGTRVPRGRAWVVIAAAGLRAFLRRRVFMGLLLLSWLPFVVRAVQIYASVTFPQMAFIKPTAETFRQFIGQQDPFVFFVTAYVGAGLIANDRRANALQLYLSKPLTRGEYIFGKMAILVTFLLMVTWVPAMVLLLFQVAFAGSFTFLRENLYLFPAITVFSFIEVTMVSTAILALSSLSKNSRFAGVMYAALIFFSDALFGVLRVATQTTSVSWVSLGSNLAQVGDAIFRVSPRYATPLPVSVCMVGGIVALSAWVLQRRVRGVEVVE